MSGGKGGGSQTTTQTNEPWGPLQDYYKEAAAAASGEFGRGPAEYFPGSTVVPFSPQSEAALDAQELRARGGNPLLPQAQGYASDVLGGAYLGANPYTDALLDSVQGDARSAIDSAYARSGRYGSGLHAEALGRGITDASAPYLFDDYARERGFMQDVAGGAADLSQADYYDIGKLGDVGYLREGKAEQDLADQIARHDFGQGAEAENIQQYMQLLSGYSPFGVSTSTTPTYSSPLGGLLGAGLLGASLFTGF